jgi:S-adenosylmethionine:tRNA ribosyltransferase-isomerase
LTHAAGISSTGDPELDKRLPFDEPYIIPETTADAIQRARAAGGMITAIGTTVVRALESAAIDSGSVTPGPGSAHGRIGSETKLQVVDTVLTGMHEPGEIHFELLRAFADDTVLQLAHRTVTENCYRSHEFGDFMLLEQADAA